MPDAWQQPHLKPLLPGVHAVVCRADADDKGNAQLSYWVPGKVHDANMDAVSAAQDSDWARLDDNWYGTSGDFESPKWSTLGTERGDALRIEVQAAGVGARVVLKVAGFPPPPELRGDVTLFAYRKAVFALHDRQLSVLPGVTGGAVLGLDDGFYFTHAHGRYGRYGADGSVELFPKFPSEGSGSLAFQGLGPKGMPWMVNKPGGVAKVIFGELVDGAWQTETAADLDPPIPESSVAAVHTPGGRIWMSVYDVLYVKDGGRWHSTKLPRKPNTIYGFVAASEDVVYPTDKGVVRASFQDGAIATSMLVKMSFPKLADAAAGGIVARNERKTMLIVGDEVSKLELPGHGKGDSIATGASGVVAVATDKPPAIVVRAADGTVARYPSEGALPAKVQRLAVDPKGRVWALLDGRNPVVAAGGALETIPGLVAGGAQPYAISFMGDGAEPQLDMPPTP